MSEEVALTTDSSSESPCVLCWDNKSWMQLKTYKNGTCSCLSLLSQSYILAAQVNKPFIHVWDISKEQMHSKMICPGNITALAVSPDGQYCAAASSEIIYIWQVSTGYQLSTFSKHFQTITCLSFTDDSSYLISGADDCTVLVWSFVRVLSPSDLQKDLMCRYRWLDHTLPITSIHIGHGGKYARVVTSSLDHTCKLWDLSTGYLLQSFTFDVAIFSVVMDPAEYKLFAGGSEGKIYVEYLFSQTLARGHLQERSETHCFVGHSMQVVSLSLSMDATKLLSGSKDCTARVWDVSSRQCKKVLEHKGCVDNVQFYPRYRNFDVKPIKTSLPVLGTFSRTFHNFNSEEENIPVRIFDRNNCNHEKQPTQYSQKEFVLRENCENDEIFGGDKNSSKFDVKKLKESNQTLYTFAVEELLAEVHENAHETDH